ncbi:MAG TPA: hypothetical protein VFA25_08765 [Actinomycetota bacterium]|nr:hypothetical protein [Actinomycetota bacterium]
MKVRLLAVLLILAVACGGDGNGVAGEDYVTQIERVSVNAHIQERGLARDLQRRLKQAGSQAEKLEALKVFAEQSARLYRDVIDALSGLEPPADASTAQDRYGAAWQDQLRFIVKVRDAGFGVRDFVESLDSQLFKDATVTTRTRCEQLQQALSADAAGVDLACDGKA